MNQVLIYNAYRPHYPGVIPGGEDRLYKSD